MTENVSGFFSEHSV